MKGGVVQHRVHSKVRDNERERKITTRTYNIYARKKRASGKGKKNQIYAGPALSTRSPTLTVGMLRPSRAFFIKWVGTGATMGGE